MSEKACPLPSGPGQSDHDAIKRMLEARTIAVVGLSDDPNRASYHVAQYLKEQGKQIIPINPTCQTVLGLKCYASLEEVPGPIDLVDVFRRPEYCPDIVRSSIAKRVKGVWLQAGIISAESRELARQAGIDYVEDRCMMVEHRAYKR
jgi:uncharacterized protein